MHLQRKFQAQDVYKRQVYPAAQFITYFQGNHLVVINKEKLDIMLNPETDLMITDSLGNVFQEINQWL